jgi:hypothetical protein
MRWIAFPWQNWVGWRHGLAAFHPCDVEEFERIARDAGVTAGELRILAGKWPNAADQLKWRMERLCLSETKVAAAEPAVMRDLQRVCSLCAGKPRCERDLIARPNDRGWQAYCPNAMTLSALVAEHRPG